MVNIYQVLFTQGLIVELWADSTAPIFQVGRVFLLDLQIRTETINN